MFPSVRVVANAENVGFARAGNAAMSRARGRVLLHLNPDVIVPSGALEAAVAELESRPEVGMLGCKLVRADGTFDHACKRGAPTVSAALYYFFGLGRLFPRSKRFAHYTAGQLDRDEVGYVDAVTGAFMLVRRKAVEDVGGMDERFWLYGEDLDWCARFRASGWKILYWPRVEIVHVKGGSAGGPRSWAPRVAFHRSMWLYYEKHLARRHSPALTILVRAGIWANFVAGLLVTWWRRSTAAPRSVQTPGSADRLSA
jgi:GT2 family glycosyltransferase